MKFKSEHKLKFLTAPHLIAGAPTGLEKFEVGTCHGLWRQDKASIEVWAVINGSPGNGHMDDVMQWFLELARLQNVILAVMDISNLAFKNQLILKWGFQTTKANDRVIKFDFIKTKKKRNEKAGL